MIVGRRYRDRADAGRQLASHLREYRRRADVVVLGLPRGGVPVAAEVARFLEAPLDVILVRKLGVPGHTELALGAIASGGVRVVNDSVLRSLRIGPEVVDRVAREEQEELDRRLRAYRGHRTPPEVSDRTVIAVDDGLATGATMRAAVAALRAQGPARLVVAVPVGARQTCDELRGEADEVVCARTPSLFQAVGQYYDDFSPPSDDHIRALLDDQHSTAG